MRPFLTMRSVSASGPPKYLANSHASATFLPSEKSVVAPVKRVEPAPLRVHRGAMFHSKLSGLRQDLHGVGVGQG